MNVVILNPKSFLSKRNFNIKPYVSPAILCLSRRLNWNMTGYLLNKDNNIYKSEAQLIQRNNALNIRQYLLC